MTTRQSWELDDSLVQAVRQQFDQAIASYRANPHLVSEHANHEESIRVGGYANRTLLELVQNAADAMAGPSDEGGGGLGRVEIVLDTDRQILYCANAGRPFSAAGLTAITHAHLSGKRGDEIGRFGLGFKSVLAVSDSPQVFSRSVSFEFNSPEARATIAEVEPTANRYPVLRTATVLNPLTAFEEDNVLAELAEWAATVVKLPRVSSLEGLRREMEEFWSEFLLFVPAVREIKLKVIGSERFETTHASRDLGDGILKIERPNGRGDEWFVEARMHEPSSNAREQVGEAVSRAKVKISVAIPRKHPRQRGQLWSYFPLQDQTSASGLFNAPWSVNDDRTTLLKNDYNREILAALSDIFVALLPRVITAEDPAAHLDYMPARGREALSFGDELLCAHVPQISAGRDLVPNASGALKRAVNLRPLDFTIGLVEADLHEAWIVSPHTGADVPHWRCYTTQQRFTRLRQIFVTAASRDGLGGNDRDVKRALENMPKRGLLSWLREWAEGTDSESAANAFRFVINPGQRGLPDLDHAKVIPTTDGMRALVDRSSVYLHQDEGVEIEGAVFVAPEFLAEADVEEGLRKFGFRDLDPRAILNARVAALSGASGEQAHCRVWEAAREVPVRTAVKVLTDHASTVKVPTLDGGWAWPRQVFDLDATIGEEHAGRVLDRRRCLPEAADRLGVISEPKQKFPMEDEPYFDEYRTRLLATLNSKRKPGEHRIENIEIFPGEGPGPFSALFLLRDAGASDQIRERWTVGLLEPGDSDFTCEDLDTGGTYSVRSPVRWAVECAGVLQSTRGLRPAADVVAPSLVRYEKLLPLFRGRREVVEALNLPADLDSIPGHVLKEALEAELFPPTVDDTALVSFVEAASRIAYPGAFPPSIPARVRRAVEGRPPAAVYLATTDEHVQFLFSRERPYLRVTDDQVADLVKAVGCRRFEDAFAFSMLIEGEQESERLIDVFTGLRDAPAMGQVKNATVARAMQVIKRVATEDGVEDQSLEWHLDGLDLVVRSDTGEGRLLSILNEAFDLRLTNAELDEVLATGINNQLERLRLEAKAASTDAERLEVYFGPDDLCDALPIGLWKALEAQGVVDDRTSVGDLFLTVYGSDSVKQLADAFRDYGFRDVPDQWAGGPMTVSWLRKMGFEARYAGHRNERQDAEFVVPGAVKLNPLHWFQQKISRQLRDVLTERDLNLRHHKAMVELPTGAGKTRVATESVLRLFIEGNLAGPILWIAPSQELCEQAVQTWSTVWRGLGDERPLTLGRLWEGNAVSEPETEFSVVVATDAKLSVILDRPDYEWLRGASAVFVDEGHRAGSSERYTKILNWLGVAGRGWERPLIGLSATPFKGKSETATAALASRFGNVKIDAFDGDAYEQLAKLGVLARVQHKVLQGVEVGLEPGEFAEATEQRRVSPSVLDRIGRDQARMSILVDDIMRIDSTWPVLVFTPNILSAQVLAATLRYQGVQAASVSGQTGRQERRDTIQRFKNGNIRVIANCDLLIQGFDAPGVRALYIARPTFSPNAYIQMAGRGLRGPANGGKDQCLIVDMQDNFGDANDLLGYREYEDLWEKQRP